jgi:hypothetical protein
VRFRPALGLSFKRVEQRFFEADNLAGRVATIRSDFIAIGLCRVERFVERALPKLSCFLCIPGIQLSDLGR